jgi:hypothetical protein
MRIDEEDGEDVEFDDIDNAFIHAIGACLPDTLCRAWAEMVPDEPLPTQQPETDFILH